MHDPLIPRDRATEHLRVVTGWSPLLERLVLINALNMLDLRQLNELVDAAYEAELGIEAGAFGDFHAATLRRAKYQ